MSDTADLIRSTEQKDKIIVLYFCGQPVELGEFYGGYYMWSPNLKEGNA